MKWQHLKTFCTYGFDRYSTKTWSKKVMAALRFELGSIRPKARFLTTLPHPHFAFWGNRKWYLTTGMNVATTSFCISIYHRIELNVIYLYIYIVWTTLRDVYAKNTIDSIYLTCATQNIQNDIINVKKISGWYFIPQKCRIDTSCCRKGYFRLKKISARYIF